MWDAEKSNREITKRRASAKSAEVAAYTPIEEDQNEADSSDESSYFMEKLKGGMIYEYRLICYVVESSIA